MADAAALVSPTDTQQQQWQDSRAGHDHDDESVAKQVGQERFLIPQVIGQDLGEAVPAASHHGHQRQQQVEREASDAGEQQLQPKPFVEEPHTACPQKCYAE